VLAIVAWMRDRLAGYLTVLGLTGPAGIARLLVGQFHDVVLVGEVACRFPRDSDAVRVLPVRPVADQPESADVSRTESAG